MGDLSLLKNFKKNSSLPIEVISYKKNKGKGYAVKQGMLKVQSDYALLCDADMSTPFSQLFKFVKFIENAQDIIIGTRKNGKSTVIVHQPKFREILGKSFTQITRIALQINATDFTCGFKLFSKKAVDTIFTKTKINRWGYDAEILFIAKKENFKINECAVLWADVKKSHVNVVKAIFETLYELVQIHWFHSNLSIYAFSARIAKSTISLF